MQTFAELAISPPLLQALEAMGFTTPSPIQAETLPILLGEPTDFLGLAATGTGKTAAFAIPLLDRLEKSARGVKALILCPTRELAIQVAGQIDLLGKFKGIRSVAIYGGTGYSEQIAGLRSGAQVVVGTPGRVVDHLEKGTLRLDTLETLVLDEADEMISMGFKEDLESVLDAAPKGQANIWLFSATMSPEVRGVADAYLKNPQKVQVNRTEMVPSTVEQLYYMIHEYDKPRLVTTLIDAAEDFYGIIFCQTKALVADLTQFLKDRGYNTDCLHGDLTQEARDRTMNAFRERKVTVLVATDVACRGLDVKDISHVINYSIPRELDNYVHRIGRTGRSGKSGIAMSLVTRSHRELLGRIEKMTKSRMKEGTIPSGRDIALKKVTKARDTFAAKPPEARLTDLLRDVWAPALEAMSKEEIVSRFMSLNYPDLTQTEEPAREMRPREERAPARESRGGPRGERSEGGPRGGGYDRGGDRGGPTARPRYAKAGAGPGPSFEKKPWKEKREESRYEGKPSAAAAAGPAASRWKKDFKKPGAGPTAAVASKETAAGGGGFKPKKKPYGKKFKDRVSG